MLRRLFLLTPLTVLFPKLKAAALSNTYHKFKFIIITNPNHCVNSILSIYVDKYVMNPKDMLKLAYPAQKEFLGNWAGVDEIVDMQ